MNNSWDSFFEEKMMKIFTDKKTILDIGGGLRTSESKGNRLDKKSVWLEEYIKKVDYKVLDKVPDYHPDIVGDVQNLNLPDNSIDAIICIAVLEHVEEPQKAVQEIWRVLKPGGYCFLYVPFLYYYHPMSGYYKDFYRFTCDGLKYLLKDFRSVELWNVRGAIATVANLLPFFSKRTGVFDKLDRIFNKQNSNQTSGYNVFCVK